MTYQRQRYNDCRKSQQAQRPPFVFPTRRTRGGVVKLLLALHIDNDKRGKPERNDWQALVEDADYNLAL